MVGFLVVVLIAASLLFAIGTLITAGLNRPASMPHLVGAAVVELMMAAQVVVAVARLIAGTRPDSVPTFLGYALGSLLILPLGVLWALEERTRWSSVVLAVAGLTLAVVVVRMHIVWDAGT